MFHLSLLTILGSIYYPIRQQSFPECQYQQAFKALAWRNVNCECAEEKKEEEEWPGLAWS